MMMLKEIIVLGLVLALVAADSDPRDTFCSGKCAVHQHDVDKCVLDNGCYQLEQGEQKNQCFDNCHKNSAVERCYTRCIKRYDRCLVRCNNDSTCFDKCVNVKPCHNKNGPRKPKKEN
ncbi:cysteine-rich neurotrophic factor-like [Physella acuta]|uniref:cysteine-rich neurotrophic factor-like n=1 Tax=Physella acuta TaxID=109671 RepID=UPI0027DE2C8F|nr:cysteine-rich neurotrophic factor-like [Physella acuta]XP_059144220.1 cysteine-rich neurotrophic factor-like [Physella acuta]XP_059144221.1 cysteine-rich neurotrophic factor-like [Physella acuta]